MLSSSSLSIVTRSDAVRAVIARVDTIADSDTSVMRVGGSSMIPVDVRLITASKVDLKELVQRNAFRSDLFQRCHGPSSMITAFLRAVRSSKEAT
jgi:transcriptional regulator with GAF, ATPase, and Fis domain